MIASRLIGHRGVAARAPENTLAGIRCAAEAGLSWVELDVTLLGDGTPVLCHDAYLDRCTNQNGPLNELKVIDLPLLDAGGWFDLEWINEPMPLLSDALLLCQNLQLGLNLEIKPFDINPELIATKIHEELAVYWQDPKKLLVSSFELDLLAKLREYNPDLQLGMLFKHLPELWQLAVQAIQPCTIHCDHNLITPDEISLIKTSGYELYCYTCNDPVRALELFSQGVDGVFTDLPEGFDPDLQNIGYPSAQAPIELVRLDDNH